MFPRVLDVDGSVSSQPAFTAPPGSGEARRVEARDRYPATVNCGSWVIRALEIDHERQITTISPCADDMRRPQIKPGNSGAIQECRLEAVDTLAKCRKISGADVCGDYSTPRYAGPSRALLSWADHSSPAVSSAAEIAVNSKTNARLLTNFQEAFI
jgi:hypothetical protein